MFTPQGPTLRELAVQALSSIEHGYDLLAPKFDHTPFRTPDSILDAVASALDRIGPFDHGLDLCCGTGAGMQVLRELCRGSVTGVDISAGMLAVGRERADAARTWDRAEGEVPRHALPGGQDRADADGQGGADVQGHGSSGGQGHVSPGVRGQTGPGAQGHVSPGAQGCVNPSVQGQAGAGLQGNANPSTQGHLTPGGQEPVSAGVRQHVSPGGREQARPDHAPRVTWVRGDARALPFAAAFDLVVSFGAFGHFLPRELPGMFAQVHSVLRPGGRFAFPIVAPHRPSSPWYWALLGFDAAMRVRNALWRPPFVMYYRAFRLDEVRRELTRAGFDVELQTLPEFGRRPDGSPRCRLVVATRESDPTPA
ncbi:methyltransferase domain-containing protein [Streptomyces sp. NPDC058470]|uniref:methyltransferase domain-containing protein n=1 Tax=Streptomyces sp. NPDC058470 TaxID=3346515 RepID=UPI00364B4867